MAFSSVFCVFVALVVSSTLGALALVTLTSRPSSISPFVQHNSTLITLDATSSLQWINDVCDSAPICPEQTVVACCADCGPASLSSSTCLCPVTPGARCLDATAVIRDQLAAGRTALFEIGVANLCHSFFLFIENLVGDVSASLTIMSIAPTAPGNCQGREGLCVDYTRFQSSFVGNDMFFACALPNNLVDNSFLLGSVVSKPLLSNDTFWRLLLNVSASGLDVPGSFELSVTEDDGAGKLSRIETTRVYGMVKAELQCNNTVVCTFHDRNNLCHGFALPPTETPLFDYFATRSHYYADGIRDPMLTMRSDRLSWLLQLSVRTADGTQSLFPFDLSSCSLGISGVVDLSDADVSTAPEPLITFSPPPTCNIDAFLLLMQSIDTYFNSSSLVEKFGGFSAGVYALGGLLTSSDEWVSCNALLSSLSQNSDEVATVSTRACVAAEGSVEWTDDACCNPQLRLVQCCVPRAVRFDQIIKEANRAVVHRQCKHPDCVTSALTSLYQRERSEAIGASCDDGAKRALSNPLLDVDVLALCDDLTDAERLGNKPCLIDSDCYSGTCLQPSRVCAVSSSPQSYAQCLLSQMDARIKVLLLSGASEDDFKSKYSVNLPAVVGCNWNDQLSQSDCENPQYVGTSFCGISLGGGHFREVSTFGGCAILERWNEEVCLANNFIFRKADGRCYIPGVTSRDTCLPTTKCAGYPGSDVCDSYCAGTQVEADGYACSCNSTIRASTLQWDYSMCSSFVEWDTRVNPTRPSYPLCMYQNSASWGAVFCRPRGWWSQGREWIENALTDSASCTAEACSVVCANCTQTECEALGSCAVGVELDYCFFPYKIRWSADGTAEQYCDDDRLPRADGCIANQVSDSQACSAIGGSWRDAPLTKESCEGIVGCSQPTEFALHSTTNFVYSGMTFQNQSECARCGLQSAPFFRWTPARYIPAGTYQWQARSYSTEIVQTPRFARDQFAIDFSAARDVIKFNAWQTLFACRYNLRAQAVGLTVCSCFPQSGGSERCDVIVNTRQERASAVARLCTGTTDPILADAWSLSFGNSLRVSVGCTNLAVSAVSSSVWRASQTNLYSSAFVQSLILKDYDVVENRRGIIIGRVLGDGYALRFSGQLIGNATLCLQLDTSLSGSNSRFRNYDFAFTPNTEDMTKSKHLRPVGSAVRYVRAEVGANPQLCMNIAAKSAPQSGLYVPIARLSNWRHYSYFETLTSSQKGVFIIGAILYGSIWFFSVAALANFIVWWLLQTASKKLEAILQFMNMILLNAILLLRWLYFVLLLAGVMFTAPAAISVLIVELPIFFFFTVFCLVLMKWIAVASQSGARKSKVGGTPLWLRVAVALGNVVLYALLVAFIIAFSVGTTSDGGSPCSSERGAKKSAGADALSITYHVFIAAIALLFGVGFLFYGGLILFQLVKLGAMRSSSQRLRFIQFSAIIATCSFAMVAQCIVLLATTFAGSINEIGALILLIVIELLPVAALIWTLNKPLAFKRAFATLTSSVGATTTTTGGASGPTTNAPSYESESGASSGVSRLWSFEVDSLGDASSVE